ncbi:methyltransferase [Nocardia sp. NPDC051321]|uniref:methyltransferase n=1 Tax=Nocardia sp. NPDC051321 TaxID=3364323 RepID=UPI0037A1D7C0
MDLVAVSELLALANYTISFTLRAVADLGIADYLEAGPEEVGVLAEKAGVDASVLARMLRALVAHGVFAETAPAVFALNNTAAPLRSGHPNSVRSACHLPKHDVLALAELTHTARTGETAFEYVHGRTYWEYLADHPDEAAIFDAGQAALARLQLRTIVRLFRWPDGAVVADLGGGNGVFLAGLLVRFPALRGILVDLPHACAQAAQVLRTAQVLDRCRVVAGTVLDSVPAGADVYVLNRVLYGWDDDAVVRILANVRAALGAEARVLIVEPLADAGARDRTAVTMDMLMMALSSGRIRTTEELSELSAAAGLVRLRTVGGGIFPVLEMAAV